MLAYYPGVSPLSNWLTSANLEVKVKVKVKFESKFFLDSPTIRSTNNISISVIDLGDYANVEPDQKQINASLKMACWQVRKMFA